MKKKRHTLSSKWEGTENSVHVHARCLKCGLRLNLHGPLNQVVVTFHNAEQAECKAVAPAVDVVNDFLGSFKWG
jgi:hypothetical protein